MLLIQHGLSNSPCPSAVSVALKATPFEGLEPGPCEVPADECDC